MDKPICPECKSSNHVVPTRVYRQYRCITCKLYFDLPPPTVRVECVNKGCINHDKHSIYCGAKEITVGLLQKCLNMTV